MKKFILCTTFFLILCTGFCYFMEFNCEKKAIPQKEKLISEKENLPTKNIKTNYDTFSTRTDSQIKKLYKLKEYEGNIAIFKCGKETPLKTTSINVNELPPVDREILKQGIEASSEEELNLLLEDYCS